MMVGCDHVCFDDATPEQNTFYLLDSGSMYDKPSPQLSFDDITGETK